MIIININNIEWLIDFVEWDNVNLIRYDGSLSIGMCDCANRIIYINNELFGDKLRSVITHEITHAFNCSYNVVLPIEQEEQMASYVETINYLTNKIWEAL